MGEVRGGCPEQAKICCNFTGSSEFANSANQTGRAQFRIIQKARFRSVLWCEKVRNERRRAADLFWPISLLQLGESFVPTVQFYTATGDSIFV